MDPESWTFIEDLGKSPKSLVILATNSEVSGTVLSNEAQIVLNLTCTRKVALHGLQPQCIAPLVCQLLKVQEIPMRLDKLVHFLIVLPSVCIL